LINAIERTIRLDVVPPTLFHGRKVGIDSAVRAAQARRLSLRVWRTSAKFSPKFFSALAAEAGNWSVARGGFCISSFEVVRRLV